MLDALSASLTVASSGLEAQSARMRVVSENLANASSTGRSAGADPYQRKTITFDAAMDRAWRSQLAKVKEIGVGTAPDRVEYDPGHPAADKAGYDKLNNVNMMIEMAA